MAATAQSGKGLETKRPPTVQKTPQVNGRRLRIALSLIFGFVAWELLGRYVITNRLFFAPLSDVIEALFVQLVDGSIYKHMYVSGAEFLLGYALAITIGIAVGTLMGASPSVADVLEPWVAGLYATPLVALTPFFILVFGIGIASKAALVFIMAVFPVLLNTYAGIMAVEKNFLEVAHSFNATRAQKVTKVMVPGALPFVISGLRIASGRALTAVVVGELFFSSAGIGHLIALSSQTFNSPKLFAGVLIFSVGGVLTTALLAWVEQRMAPWRKVT